MFVDKYQQDFQPDYLHWIDLQQISSRLILFAEPIWGHRLVEAIEDFGSLKIDPKACRENAQLFAENVFDEAVIKHVEAILREFKGK